MNGKKEFTDLLSKTLVNDNSIKRKDNPRLRRTVQDVSARPTTDKSIFKGSSRTVLSRNGSKPKRTANGVRRQTRRQVVPGLRFRRRQVSLAKQRFGTGVPRTSRGNVMKPGNKPKKPKHPKRKPGKPRGIGIAYKTKNMKPRMKEHKTSNGKNCRITGTEFLCDLNPQDSIRSRPGAPIFESNLSPLLIPASALSQEAKMWQEYKVHSWKYYFTSACPTNTAGQIGIGITSDPTITLNEEGDSAIRKFEKLDYHKEINPWDSMTVEFNGHGQDWYKIALDEDSRLFIAGKVIVLNYTPISPRSVVQSVGKIHIEYDIEFRDPFIQPGLIQADPSFQSLLTSTAAVVEGDPFTLAEANFMTTPDPNTIYMAIVESQITIGGVVVALGPTDDSYPMVPGTIWYMKRDTAENRYFFYPFMPDDAPSADQEHCISTDTHVSGALAGLFNLYPEAYLGT